MLSQAELDMTATIYINDRIVGEEYYPVSDLLSSDTDVLDAGHPVIEIVV